MAQMRLFRAALIGLPLLVSGCSEIGNLFSAGAEDPADESSLEPGVPATAADFAAYDADLAAVQTMPLTGNMPMSGTAAFNGATMMTMTNTTTGADSGDVMADVAMTVDFDPAAADPVSTTLSDIQYMAPDGTIESWGGELSSDPDVYASTISTTDSTVSDGAGGTVTITTGSLDTTATGDINDGVGVYDMTVNLEGDFYGDDASGAAGVATGTIDNLGEPGVWVLNGTFWVLQTP